MQLAVKSFDSCNMANAIRRCLKGESDRFHTSDDILSRDVTGVEWLLESVVDIGSRLDNNLYNVA